MKQSGEYQYVEPNRRAMAETVVRNSRFISYVVPVDRIGNSAEQLRQIRRAHPGSSHVVHACITGYPAREDESLSDDGEPHGTAGRPVMDILRGSDCRNAMIAVVRYFGGTKLGKGGLVRAYGQAAKAALAVTDTRPLIQWLNVEMKLPYACYGAVQRVLEKCRAHVVANEYGEDVRLEVRVPERSAEQLVHDVRDATAGSAIIRTHRS